MRVLDLFSGIGGFSLGLERAGMETVAFCEIDKFCQRVLKKHWPNIPIFEDVRTLPDEFTGTVDVITGGYPCQPFSTAGRRKAQEDPRHLWPAMFACIKIFKPAWVIAENVAGHINLGLDEVLADLESEGYACQAFVIPACAVGAPHRRDRVWIVANSNSSSESRASKQDARAIHQERLQEWNEIRQPFTASLSSNTNNIGRKGSECETIQRQPIQSREFKGSYQEWRSGWPVSSPRVCGVDDGIPNRTHRLRSLGNAVVPQIPEIIGRAIMEQTKGHAQ